ncbi:MAG: hypothetical protein N2169_07525, partial [bacterium]|nr:hypothetical protein [bacterium]
NRQALKKITELGDGTKFLADDGIYKSGGIGGGNWTEVDYYADLPDPSEHTNKVFLVKNDSGIFPFKKKAGFYRSTGSQWKWLGVLSLSSLADVDTTGVQNNDILVYNSSSGGWISYSHNHDDKYYTETEVDTLLSQKQNTLVSGTNIKTINNQSLLGSGNITIESGASFGNLTIYDNGTKTTAFNFDYSNGFVQKVTLGASIQFGVANPSDTSKAHFLTIFIHQDSTGNRSWTGVNGTNIDLGGVSTSGLLTTTANAIDMFEFLWYSSKWRLINAVFGGS